MLLYIYRADGTRTEERGASAQRVADLSDRGYHVGTRGGFVFHLVQPGANHSAAWRATR